MSDDEGFLNEQLNFFKREDAEKDFNSSLTNSATLDLQMIHEAEKVQTPLRDFKVKKHFLDSASEISKSTGDFTQRAKTQPKPVPARASKEVTQGVSAPEVDILEMNNIIKNLMETGDCPLGSMTKSVSEKKFSGQTTVNEEKLKAAAGASKGPKVNSETTRSQSDFEISESFFKISDTEELDADANGASYLSHKEVSV